MKRFIGLAFIAVAFQLFPASFQNYSNIEVASALPRYVCKNDCDLGRKRYLEAVRAKMCSGSPDLANKIVRLYNVYAAAYNKWLRLKEVFKENGCNNLAADAPRSKKSLCRAISRRIARQELIIMRLYAKLNRLIDSVANDCEVSKDIEKQCKKNLEADLYCSELLNLYKINASLDDKVDAALAAIEARCLDIADELHSFERRCPQPTKTPLPTATFTPIPQPTNTPFIPVATATPTATETSEPEETAIIEPTEIVTPEDTETAEPTATKTPTEAPATSTPTEVPEPTEIFD
jgi:hypothetical protein